MSRLVVVLVVVLVEDVVVVVVGSPPRRRKTLRMANQKDSNCRVTPESSEVKRAEENTQLRSFSQHSAASGPRRAVCASPDTRSNRTNREGDNSWNQRAGRKTKLTRWSRPPAAAAARSRFVFLHQHRSQWLFGENSWAFMPLFKTPLTRSKSRVSCRGLARTASELQRLPWRTPPDGGGQLLAEVTDWLIIIPGRGPFLNYVYPKKEKKLNPYA